MSTRIEVPDRHAWMCPTNKWPCFCTSTGQDGSMELETAWIGPVVVELQCPQNWGAQLACPNVPDGKMTYHCTSTGQGGYMELEMAWIGPAVIELHRPQELGWPKVMSKRAWRANDLAPGPCRSTSTCWDGSMEFKMEGISPAIVLFHSNFSPSSEQPAHRKLAHEL